MKAVKLYDNLHILAKDERREEIGLDMNSLYESSFYILFLDPVLELLRPVCSHFLAMLVGTYLLRYTSAVRSRLFIFL